MKIVVNGNEFQGATWTPNIAERTATAQIQTEESVRSLVLLLDDGNDIVVYDDSDAMIAVWKNLGLMAINTIYDEPRRVEATFRVSIIGDAAEDALQEAIDDGVDGIMELAEICADVQEDVNLLKEDGEAAKTDINNLKEDMTNAKNKLDSVPSDIVDRFSALWQQYNALADRVARLENK